MVLERLCPPGVSTTRAFVNHWGLWTAENFNVRLLNIFREPSEPRQLDRADTLDSRFLEAALTQHAIGLSSADPFFDLNLTFWFAKFGF